MTDWGFVSLNDLANTTWRAYLQYEATLAARQSSEQGQYLTLVKGLVESSKGYGEDEQWLEVDAELSNATKMFCPDGDCFTDSKDLRVSGKMVGILQGVRDDYRKIYDANKAAIQYLTGDLDDPKDLGQIGEIARVRENVLKGEGTQGAIDVLNDMGTQYKNWSAFAKEGTRAKFKEQMNGLRDWIDAYTVMGRQDLDPENPNLQAGDSRTAPYLFAALNHMAVGNQEDALSKWSLWLKGGDDLAREDRRTFKTDMKKWGDKWYEDVEAIKSMEVEGADEKGGGLQDLLDVLPHKLTSASWQKDVSPAIMGQRKEMVADNIAIMMDRYSEGQANINWNQQKTKARTAIISDFKANNPLSVIEYKPTDEEINRVAVQGQFSGMDEADVRRLARGEWGFFGFGEGLDFPGYNVPGFGDKYTSEEKGENYFIKQVQLWKDANSQQALNVLNNIPGNQQGSSNLPSSKKSKDGLGLDDYDPTGNQSFIGKSGIINTYKDTNAIFGAKNASVISIDPSLNDTTNANRIDVLIQAFNGAIKGGNEPNKAVQHAKNTFSDLGYEGINHNVVKYTALDGKDYNALIIGDSKWQATVQPQLLDEFQSAPEPLTAPVDTTTVPIDTTIQDTSGIGNYRGDSSYISMNEEALKSLNQLEQLADSLDIQEFSDNNILDTLDFDAQEMFVNNADSQVFQQQINEEIDALFGENGLGKEGLEDIQTSETDNPYGAGALSASDIIAKYLNNRDEIIAGCPECAQDPFLLTRGFLDDYLGRDDNFGE